MKNKEDIIFEGNKEIKQQEENKNIANKFLNSKENELYEEIKSNDIDKINDSILKRLPAGIREKIIAISERKKKDIVKLLAERRFRKITINSRIIKNICLKIQKGASLSSAAASCGLSESLVNKWYREGSYINQKIMDITDDLELTQDEKEKLITALLYSGNNYLYLHFFESVNNSKETLREKAEKVINRELDEDRKYSVLVAQWLLENRYSNDYFKKNNQNNVNNNIQIVIPNDFIIK